MRTIAAGLGRAPSTISREVGSNGGRRRYRAATADQQAWARATRPKRCKLAANPVLAGIVAEKLRRRWSPEQIAGWLKLTYPDDPEMHVSRESIYRTLFIQSRGALRRELTHDLRTGRVIRRAQGTRLPDGRRGRPGILHISERPAEAEDRAVPGHWEGDLVFGKHMSPIATGQTDVAWTNPPGDNHYAHLRSGSESRPRSVRIRMVGHHRRLDRLTVKTPRGGRPLSIAAGLGVGSLVVQLD